MRRAPAIAAVCAAAAVAAAGAADAPAAQARAQSARGDASRPAHVVFRMRDPRLDEASGLAPAHRNPGVLYAQNDSGDSARVFAIDGRTGATRAVLQVTGARNVDWEDLAVAPDAAGRWCLWIADIGDNDAARSQVQVYRVPEPRLPAAGPASVTTAADAVWRLRYPSGATDAESLAVTPAGVAYVITKSLLGASAVYRVPRVPAGGVRVLQRVGTIRFAVHGVANPFDAAGELTATGAAVSPDGRLLAVRTYASAYVWRVRGGDVPAALRHAPVRIDLPRQRQGEGVAFAGRRLLVDSEGRDEPVYSVALPRSLFARTPTRAGSSDSSASSRSTGSSGPGAQASTGPARRSPSAHGGVAATVVGLLVLLVVVGTSLLFQRRRRRQAARAD